MTPQAYESRDPDRIPTLCEPRYSQSLERGLTILENFTPESPWQGIADIADPLGMSRSTTHRYVITLAALGLMVQGAGRKYKLSLGVTGLGMSTLNSTSLRDHSRSYLEELRQRTTYTVNLAVLDGDEILYVDRARSLRRGQNKIDLNLRSGSRLPVYCTSMGKVLLANLPEADQDKLIGEITLTRRGPNSIMSKKALRTELEHVLEEGMAVNDEELLSGLVSIACPIRCESREVVAALNLAVHTSMISVEEMADQLSPHLLATVDNISARLGFRRYDEKTL
jgi:IclR family pca regulon transcriptional regulator